MGRVLRVVTAVAVLVTAGAVARPAPAFAAANPAFSTFDLPNPPSPPGSPVVALTFDDGPSANITPAVLDTLAAYGAHATFFVVGDFAARYPDLLRRAVAMGNSVQLHTMHHTALTKLSAAGIAGEIDPEIAMVTSITGVRPTCLRPPGGNWNQTVVSVAASRGLHTVMWNVNPGDTESGSTTSSIISRALAGAKPGAIVGLHDAGTKGATLAALPAILSGLQARGLLPVSICGGEVPIRDVAVRADGRSGYRLDANGGLQPFGGAPAIAQAPALPGIARRIVLRSNGTSGYVLDGWGGIHPVGGAPAVTGGSAYWRGWDIARGLALRPDGLSGWVLDGFGGVHEWGGAPAVRQPGYWPGWDIARGIGAAGANGGYMVDGFGGVHAFGNAPVVSNGPYWPGQDRARGVVVGYDKASGYVLDVNGGVTRFGHAPPGRPTRLFGGEGAKGIALGSDGITGVVADATGAVAPFSAGPVTRAVALRVDGVSGYTVAASGALAAFGGAPVAVGAPSWPAWDIARDVALRGDGAGYVLDGLGGLHPFNGAAGIAGPHFATDLARSVRLRADGSSGYVLDAYGGLHPFGGAPVVATSGYWPGWDIARAVALRPDGASGWVLDGFGGLHPFGGAPRISDGPYFSGWDIARGVVVRADGGSGWVLDGLGGLHPFGGAPVRTVNAYAGRAVMQNLAASLGDEVVVVDTYGVRHRSR